MAVGGVTGWALVASAQQNAVPTIGVLTPVSPSPAWEPYDRSLRAGLA